jgi:hypothetical protein
MMVVKYYSLALMLMLDAIFTFGFILPTSPCQLEYDIILMVGLDCGFGFVWHIVAGGGNRRRRAATNINNKSNNIFIRITTAFILTSRCCCACCCCFSVSKVKRWNGIEWMHAVGPLQNQRQRGRERKGRILNEIVYNSSVERQSHLNLNWPGWLDKIKFKFGWRGRLATRRV